MSHSISQPIFNTPTSPVYDCDNNLQSLFESLALYERKVLEARESLNSAISDLESFKALYTLVVSSDQSQSQTNRQHQPNLISNQQLNHQNHSKNHSKTFSLSSSSSFTSSLLTSPPFSPQVLTCFLADKADIPISPASFPQYSTLQSPTLSPTSFHKLNQSPSLFFPPTGHSFHRLSGRNPFPINSTSGSLQTAAEYQASARQMAIQLENSLNSVDEEIEECDDITFHEKALIDEVICPLVLDDQAGFQNIPAIKRLPNSSHRKFNLQDDNSTLKPRKDDKNVETVMTPDQPLCSFADNGPNDNDNNNDDNNENINETKQTANDNSISLLNLSTFFKSRFVADENSNLDQTFQLQNTAAPSQPHDSSNPSSSKWVNPASKPLFPSSSQPIDASISNTDLSFNLLLFQQPSPASINPTSSPSTSALLPVQISQNQTRLPALNVDTATVPAPLDTSNLRHDTKTRLHVTTTGKKNQPLPNSDTKNLGESNTETQLSQNRVPQTNRHCLLRKNFPFDSHLSNVKPTTNSNPVLSPSSNKHPPYHGRKSLPLTLPTQYLKKTHPDAKSRKEPRPVPKLLSP